MSEDPYLIKRYSNRKLYDSVRRRFTTLDEVAKLLEQGVKILVRDHDNGADRTDEVLAQVLGRRVRQSSNPGTSDLLSGLLRTPADLVSSVVDRINPASEESTAKPEPEPEPEPTPAARPEQTKADPREQEISELRDQVAQLTEAVSLLLKDKNDELQRRKEDD